LEGSREKGPYLRSNTGAGYETTTNPKIQKIKSKKDANAVSTPASVAVVIAFWYNEAEAEYYVQASCRRIKV
jgi:hypothetical protein